MLYRGVRWWLEVKGDDVGGMGGLLLTEPEEADG